MGVMTEWSWQDWGIIAAVCLLVLNCYLCARDRYAKQRLNRIAELGVMSSVSAFEKLCDRDKRDWFLANTELLDRKVRELGVRRDQIDALTQEIEELENQVSGWRDAESQCDRCDGVFSREVVERVGNEQVCGYCLNMIRAPATKVKEVSEPDLNAEKWSRAIDCAERAGFISPIDAVRAKLLDSHLPSWHTGRED